jgi:3-isopropylmalate dehydrogenase
LLYPELAAASTLKPEVVAGLDIIILRELTGDIYFGHPRGRRTNAAGETEGLRHDALRRKRDPAHREGRLRDRRASERRAAHLRSTKANVLDTSIFWREIVTDVGRQYPTSELTHMYVDNAALQLVRNPRGFDVIVTGQPVRRHPLRRGVRCSRGRSGCCRPASLDANGKRPPNEPIHGSGARHRRVRTRPIRSRRCSRLADDVPATRSISQGGGPDRCARFAHGP